MKLLPPRRSDALRDLRRRLAGAALALGALGAPATAQLAPPQAPAVPAVAGPAEIQGPVLPATLPPYDEGLRTIVGFAEEGRGDEALMWSLAYLDLKLPAPEAPTDESGEAAAPPAPQLPELPPAPELTESQRAALHYALAVILAGAPTRITARA